MCNLVWIKNVLTCKIYLSLSDKYILILSEDEYNTIKHKYRVNDIVFYRVGTKYRRLGTIVSFCENSQKYKIAIEKMNCIADHSKNWFLLHNTPQKN
jgi:hypothetical protein